MIAPRVGWDDYVHLAFDEIRHYSRRSMQVARWLTAAVEDLLTLAPGDRRGVLQEQLDLSSERCIGSSTTPWTTRRSVTSYAGCERRPPFDDFRLQRPSEREGPLRPHATCRLEPAPDAPDRRQRNTRPISSRPCTSSPVT